MTVNNKEENFCNSALGCMVAEEKIKGLGHEIEFKYCITVLGLNKTGFRISEMFLWVCKEVRKMRTLLHAVYNTVQVPILLFVLCKENIQG
jgi:hypothetical protein